MSGEQFDDPNRQAVGLDPAWVEGEGGEPGELAAGPQAEQGEVEPQAAADENDDLPGRHAPLDELAAERGHTWSREDLTVAEKKAELGG